MRPLIKINNEIRSLSPRKVPQVPGLPLGFQCAPLGFQWPSRMLKSLNFKQVSTHSTKMLLLLVLCSDGVDGVPGAVSAVLPRRPPHGTPPRGPRPRAESCPRPRAGPRGACRTGASGSAKGLAETVEAMDRTRCHRFS